MFKVHYKNTRMRPLTLFFSGFIVNLEHISHFFQVFLWLTLNKYMLAGLTAISPIL